MNQFELEDIKTIILAGGKGTRMKGTNSETPKVLLKSGGSTLLESSLKNVREFGLKNLIYKLGYESSKIIKFIEAKKLNSERIKYVIEDKLLGTCGGLNKFKNDEFPFLIIYGDVVSNINLSSLLKFHNENNSQATLVVHESDHPEDSDVVVLGDDNRVKKIVNKPESLEYGNLTNAAMYLINPECFSFIPNGQKFDFGKDLFPILINSGIRIFGYKTNEYIRDAGTFERFTEVTEDLNNNRIFNKVEAVFLDRDGTVIEEKNLLTQPSQVSLIPGSSNGVMELNNARIPVIMVTNQPVVARNLSTESEVIVVNNKIQELLKVSSGSYLDEIYFCPHHPDKGYPEENPLYKIKCDCRKPEGGMLTSAANERRINLANSFIIGDTTTDVETGRRLGMKTIMVRTGYGGSDKKFEVKPDFICDNLNEAVKIVLDYNKTRVIK